MSLIYPVQSPPRTISEVDQKEQPARSGHSVMVQYALHALLGHCDTMTGPPIKRYPVVKDIYPY
jgi:hypothetical protein